MGEARFQHVAIEGVHNFLKKGKAHYAGTNHNVTHLVKDEGIVEIIKGFMISPNAPQPVKTWSKQVLEDFYPEELQGIQCQI